MDLSLSIITILLPLFTFFVLGLVGMKMPKQTAGFFGTLSMLVTAVVAYGVALSYFLAQSILPTEFARLRWSMMPHGLRSART